MKVGYGWDVLGFFVKIICVRSMLSVCNYLIYMFDVIVKSNDKLIKLLTCFRF